MSIFVGASKGAYLFLWVTYKGTCKGERQEQCPFLPLPLHRCPKRSDVFKPTTSFKRPKGEERGVKVPSLTLVGGPNEAYCSPWGTEGEGEGREKQPYPPFQGNGDVLCFKILLFFILFKIIYLKNNNSFKNNFKYLFFLILIS